MLKQVLTPAYRLLDRPAGYAFIQRVNYPSVLTIRHIIRDWVTFSPDDRVLDLGCGIGNYRSLFAGDYVGIDINPDYIDTCSKLHSGQFATMDAAKLAIGEGVFDAVVTVAITHHLDDDQLVDMAEEAMRVLRPGGMFHVIDAVLPRSRLSAIKTAWFRLDRGDHPRKQDHLLDLLGRAGTIVETELRRGPMHDIVYARLVKLAPSG